MNDFKIKVLIEPGKTVPLEELSKEEQEEANKQLKMVFECLEVSEDDEDYLLNKK